ncbi:MAG: Hsp20/alpha crystallin family protein [Deltaproteobacteria bacterium]|nr:Hsp20/alpha crystallin family protein [Deltaproteobacteria bacterium]
MAIVKWDPFKDLVSIQERMNRLFDETFGKVTRGEGEELARGVWSPVVDIYETDDNIVMKAELPGIDKKDVSIEVKDNMLVLKGERRFEKEVKEDNYHRMERSYGSFQRTFTLPNIVEKDNVSAKYKDGVLEITLPKSKEAKPKQIKVEVE